MSNISISLPDGSVRELPAGSNALDLASSIGSRLAQAAVAATINGSETDLTRPIPDGAQVAIITANTDAGRHVLRHSTAHLLARPSPGSFPERSSASDPRSRTVSTTTSTCRTARH